MAAGFRAVPDGVGLAGEEVVALHAGLPRLEYRE
jgi:hypothetical protein